MFKKNNLLLFGAFLLIGIQLFLPTFAFAQNSQKIELFTSGNCGMCKDRIEKAANGTGVKSANWDAATQILTLEINNKLTNKEDIKKRVADVGHDIDGLLANDQTYSNLHACCIYDRVQKNNSKKIIKEGHEVWKVAGVCGMCKTRIEKMAQGDGLISATYQIDKQELELQFDPVKYDPEAAQERILQSGHDVNGQMANQESYHALPACCLYKDVNNPHIQSNHSDQSDQEKTVVGVVVQENEKGELTPIPHASISWIEDPLIKTQTDSDGVFNITHKDNLKNLQVSFAGFEPQKVQVEDINNMLVVRFQGNKIAEVTISGRRSSNFISTAGANRIETLTSAELFKAACCDLSESFETNASVEVVNSDAVTGSKQIQMLGLSGNYTQLTVENLPGPRGLASPLGLSSIAGTWIESIQISKGIGSVVNGYENMTGQINVELKKPDASEKALFNLYINEMGRSDVNLNLAYKLNANWSTAVLLHDNFNYNKNINTSHNGFRDVPTGNIFSGINRWKYENGMGFIAQFGLKYLKDDRVGGEIDFNPNQDRNQPSHYGIGYDISRFEVFGKLGYIFPERRHRSIGLQFSASNYDQDSYFGLREYKSQQQSLYGNLIYQDIIGTTQHKIRGGISAQLDKYDEFLINTNFKRTEVVPGVFGEYTYLPHENLDVVAGFRMDYNNLYGWFYTPRLHMRYQPLNQTIFRLSAGKGHRTANIFAENIAALASSRIINVQNTGHLEAAYGLSPEIIWNVGVSVDQHFHLFNLPGSLSLEYYRNDFTNQVVIDYENPREINFYNLQGKSYANSFQTEFRITPLPRFELRTAYRLYDIKTTYQDQLLEKPLVAKHRGFFNAGYQTANKNWSFDYTLNIVGQKRLPSTIGNPVSYQLPEYSKTYTTMNAQITKHFNYFRPFDIYVGAENFGNFYQKNPIIAHDQPFGQYFDSSLVWGPLTGRMIYAGIRLSVL